MSIGIGRIQRGFERYFIDLFGALREHVDITLYKSAGGETAVEVVPTLLNVATPLVRLLPLGEIGTGTEYRTYKHDCVAFGLSVLPHLIKNRYDVIHYIDYPLGRVLRHLQSIVRFNGRLLLTNGCCMPTKYYPRETHIHHVAEPLYREAVDEGIPASRMTLAPCGIHASRFERKTSRQELRARYGIRPETFVILAVTAVKKAHKRVDHIIEEVSRLEGDVLLWIDGNPEDPTVPELARRKLGDRCRITHVRSDDIGDLYHAADVMVHAALEESFGLAIVEALSTGLTVLTHHSPHFEWLTGARDGLVNMETPGALAERLTRVRAAGEKDSAADGARAERARRFDWSSLVPQYLEMYRKLGPARPAIPAGQSAAASAFR